MQFTVACQAIKYAAMKIQGISGNSIIIPRQLAAGCLLARGYYDYVSVCINEEMV